MKLTRLRLVPWSTDVAAGALNARFSWARRAGLLIELETSTGLVGRGEASPLPGYSPDGLDDCEAALRSLDPSAWKLPDDALCVEAAWSVAERSLPRYLPAARCAIEAALADLYAMSARVPLWKLLRALPSSPTAPGPTPHGVAALLAESNPVALAGEARQRVTEGYRGVKLKSSGMQSLVLERERWDGVRDVATQHGAALRLDANQTWPEDELDEWLGAAAELGVEFVEEPIPLHRPWRGAPCPVPTALDESLARLENWPSQVRLEQRNVRAVIVKPTMLGLRRALGAAAWARSLGLEVVVTHAFEGAYGYALALGLASAVGSPSLAHGLAPYPILATCFPDVTFDGLATGELRLSTRPGLGMTWPRGEGR